MIDAISELGILEDTLVYYIIGDGASAEGTLIGTTNEAYVAEAPDLATPELMIDHIDDLGSPRANNHYAVGWAHAMDTPYQWTKQVASHWGGTRNGTIVHWPNGFNARGEIRNQFHHVIDVGPTVLEAAGLPFPTTVNGVMQEPFHGVGMAYSFDEADAAERHETQYFEMFCNRGIYHKSWSAVTKHRTPWEVHGSGGSLADDPWELYNGTTDWSQAHDLAAEHPDKLAELKRLFDIEAAKYNVLPLGERMVERFNPESAGRPASIAGNTADAVRVLQQLRRTEARLRRFGGGRADGSSPSAIRVRVRRWRHRQGRPGHVVRRRGTRSAKAESSARMRCRSRWTKPSTSAVMPACPSRRTMGPVTASSPAPSSGHRSMSASRTSIT